MKRYLKGYYNLIENAKSEKRSKKTGIFEKHHIIPKSFGGSDTQKNLVLLTPKEHYIAHYLLTKFTRGRLKRSAVFAFQMMNVVSDTHNRKLIPRLYEKNKILAREETIKQNKELFSGENNPMYGKSTSEYVKKFWDNVSEDWVSERNKNVSQGTKIAMNKLSKEKKAEMSRKQIEAQKNQVTCWDLIEHQGKRVPKEEFDESNHLVGIVHRLAKEDRARINKEKGNQK